MDNSPGHQWLMPGRDTDIGNERLRSDTRGAEFDEDPFDTERETLDMAIYRRLSNNQRKSERHADHDHQRRPGRTERLVLSSPRPEQAGYRAVARGISSREDDGRGSDNSDSGGQRPTKPTTILPSSLGMARQRGSPHSSGSGSTITREAFETQEAETKVGSGTTYRPTDSAREKQPHTSNVLGSVEQDFPAVAAEDRSKQDFGGVEETWSPRSSTDSYLSTNTTSGQRRDSVETDATSVDGDEDMTVTAFRSRKLVTGERTPVDVRYATRPRTAHGKQQHAFPQPDSEVHASRRNKPEATSRESSKRRPTERNSKASPPSEGYTHYSQKAEKLPMTGYELLASRLSGLSESSQRGKAQAERSIMPIYRRFGALNHRLLLHLQDELSELEEQLHRLDTADTQARRLQNGFLPASRRNEYMLGGELQWHRTDILGKIGFKLGQYNQVLGSFAETQNLPSASLPDIQNYRTYLSKEDLISEAETRFLDPVEDLLCLTSNHPPSPGESASAEMAETVSSSPMPNTVHPPRSGTGISGWQANRSNRRLQGVRNTNEATGTSTSNNRPLQAICRPDYATHDVNSDNIDVGGNSGVGHENMRLAHVAGLASLAISPVILLPVIPKFVGRMAVVLVVSLGIAVLGRKLVEDEFEFWIIGGRVCKACDLVTIAVAYALIMIIVVAAFP